MDPNEMRFRAQQSPGSDATTMNSLVSPPRNRLSQNMSSQQDPRSTLSRRFTTDSGRVPTLSSSAAPRGQDPSEYQTMQHLQLIEKKRMEYEKIREQKRIFDAELAKHEVELGAMLEEHGRLSGHQSEPTTPPEYRENPTGFPSVFSRPNRYSLSSLTSPPGLANRSARSGSVLASPQSGVPLSRFAFDDQLPSWSVPGSRRNSDEDEKEEAVRQDPTSHRSTNAVNRYSMPVTKSRTAFYDINLDQANTTGFLFGDDDNVIEGKVYTQANNEDNFPVLRREPNMLWALTTTFPVGAVQQNTSASLTDASQSNASSEASIIATRPASFRHSLEMKNMDQKYTDPAADAPVPTNNGSALATPPKLQPSHSANDIPTLKSVSGTTVGGGPNQAAQQHLHNHNASMGRIPAGALPSRHSRELSGDTRDTVASANYQSIGSSLHANAPSFGPALAQPSNVLQGPVLTQPSQTPLPPIMSPGQAMSPYNSNNGGYYAPNGYGNVGPANGGGNYHALPLLAQMQGLSLNGGGNTYSAQNYTGYAPVYAPHQPRDSQQRIMASRRQQDNEAMSRFNGTSLESYGGSIYELCKDQHGCRFLQKQLESRNPDHVHMIWLETCSHVIELMTDPFGNYLCQKLFEFCNDDERTVLVQNASKDMVRIALNQHGTRALQKMIEHLSNNDQVALITAALCDRVVELIQDLNGNHVIQKCLTKLSAQDAHFIFEAVGTSCVEVGTHRHGCCVLQRCIDHATGDQKLLLIQRITEHAVTLVQDPFGNYVVQYIIDLNDSIFTEPVVQKFHGRICQLSRHKFSSNVIEKCLRCASDASKDMIVDELLAPSEMDRLIRDSYANYVVQTALEHATHYMKQRLVDVIRPILPTVRSTPYGRKIQAKVSAYDSTNGRSSGQMTPADPTQGQIPIRPAQTRGMSNTTSILTHGAFQNGTNGLNNRGAQLFPTSASLTVPPPQAQYSQQYAPQFVSHIASAPYGHGQGDSGPAQGAQVYNGAPNPPMASDNGEQNFF
ncbi:pumilio domain-containing protein [Diaporthe helianthi]|uniref:Pumilio domain-containing protein n=1 Tax=Diaporthe helianthi TaxID=158607 RepID=A0A2P5I7K3_DIAHE|nr:pumilio domain-containing protein [Diaporthe helianthi]